MANPLLQVETLTKSFGDRLLFQDISFGISEGDKIGLIANNGSGKTTLLNILAGKEPYDEGRIVFRNSIRVAYLEQDPVFNPDQTVLEACFNHQNEIVTAIARYEEALASDTQEGLQDAFTQMDLLKAWDYEQRIKQILGKLNIHRLSQKMGELSGGQIKRIALANVLISEPDLILLDEPTNHLDLNMVEWLEDYLSRSAISLLMVTHDRYFLDRVCSKIWELDSSGLYTYEGNYSYFLEKREERISARNAETERAKNLLRKELEWMRRQPQARATKAKSRIDAFYKLEDKARAQKQEDNLRLAAKGLYIGNKIFEARHVTKHFGDLCITKDFSYVFSRYEKMGIVGNNGTGKSTFIKMLLGEMEPDSGDFDIGETVRFGYYSQDGLEFDNQAKVIDVVKDIAEVIDLGDGTRLTASQFLQHFLFAPDKQHNYVYKLSGGEKRRLYLCTVLIKNPNFLVLDEPTNDLDIVTLSILEDYLAQFKGCVIVISHDRYFMDKVTDHLLVFDGKGVITNYPGNYTQYREWKSQEDQKQVESVKPRTSDPHTFKPASPLKNKLTFKEKKELEQLEKEIGLFEKEKGLIEENLSSGTLPSDKLIEASTRYSDLLTLIDDKTFRWMELSERL